MERIEALIHKLQDQLTAGESPSRLLVTAGLLHAELQSATQASPQPGRGKVSVVMPFGAATIPVPVPAPVREEAAPKAVPEVEEEKIVYQLREEAPALPPAIEALEQESKPRYTVPQPPPPVVEAPPKTAIPQLFDTESAAPTLEVHQRIGANTASLNDLLKPAQTELGHVLKDTPVKDLRKAIGINDRFVFVQELFRGDDAMYERSIKTINSFGILAEAEYWINRELKVKLGWNDTAETVQHFYALVRRRFSAM